MHVSIGNVGRTLDPYHLVRLIMPTIALVIFISMLGGLCFGHKIRSSVSSIYRNRGGDGQNTNHRRVVAQAESIQDYTIDTGGYQSIKRCSYINYRGAGETNDSMTRKCPKHEVCGKTLNISYIDLPPYSTGHLFEWIVKGCCGRSCAKFKLINHYTNISEVKLSKTTSEDFILPFLGKATDVSLYGHYFIPFADVPHAYYITPKHESPIKRMLRNCSGLYKLILFSLLATIISGFIIWTLESIFGSSTSERQPFFKGVFEGCYWSFTIATAGYGASIIETLPAKVYTIIWILVGVLMFSVINSVFTVELMTILGPSYAHFESLAGEKVGVLKYRDYDASLVTREGGYVQESTASNFQDDVLELIRMLRTMEVDGLLLDKYTMKYVEGYLKWKGTTFEPHLNREHNSRSDQPKYDINYFLTATDSTLKEFIGDKMSYGVLVKKKADYLFFRDAVKDNRLSLETAVESEMNRNFPKKKGDMVASSLHNLPIQWIGAVIGLVLVIGFTAEVYKWYKEREKRDICDVV